MAAWRHSPGSSGICDMSRGVAAAAPASDLDGRSIEQAPLPAMLPLLSLLLLLQYLWMKSPLLQKKTARANEHRRQKHSHHHCCCLFLLHPLRPLMHHSWTMIGCVQPRAPTLQVQHIAGAWERQMDDPPRPGSHCTSGRWRRCAKKGMRICCSSGTG